MANKDGDGKHKKIGPVGPVKIIWSEVKISNDEIQIICDQLMSNVLIKTGKKYKKFKAVFYRKSEAIILNYIIKVYAGDKYLHLSVLQDKTFAGEQVIKLKGVQEGHKWDDPLEPF